MYAYLSATVVKIGIAAPACVAGGAIADVLAVAGSNRRPLLGVPAAVLALCAPITLVLVMLAFESFDSAFACYALYTCVIKMYGAPLYVAAQVAAPSRLRASLLGAFFCAYWLLAAAATTAIGTAASWPTRRKLLAMPALQLSAALVMVVAMQQLEPAIARVSAATTAAAEGESQRLVGAHRGGSAMGSAACEPLIHPGTGAGDM